MHIGELINACFHSFTLSGQTNSLASTCIAIAISIAAIITVFMLSEWKHAGRRRLLLTGQCGLFFSMGMLLILLILVTSIKKLETNCIELFSWHRRYWFNTLLPILRRHREVDACIPLYRSI